MEPTAEARVLRSVMRALVRRFSVSERADVSCCGMTVAQAATLEVLALEGPARLAELGRRLGISPSTLTRNLARLEERGWVERFRDPDDGRATRARLTPEGEAAARRVEKLEIEFARRVLGRLTAEQKRRMLEGFDALLSAVRGATESCCAGAYDHLMGGNDHGKEPRTEAADRR